MPLPELNTSGIDVTNTIAKIEAMKTNALQRQNLQEEMAARPTQNAIKLYQLKKELEAGEIAKAAEQRAKTKAAAEESREFAKWSAPLVESGDLEAHEKGREYLLSKGFAEYALPSIKKFVDPTTGKLNLAAYKDWNTRFGASADQISAAGIESFKKDYEWKVLYNKDDPQDTLFVPVNKKEEKTFSPSIYGNYTLHVPDKEKDTWSEPYTGPDGSRLQRNDVTGEIRTVLGREKDEPREPKGTWFTVGPTGDGKKLIQSHSISGAVRVADIPEGKKLEAKPAAKREQLEMDGITTPSPTPTPQPAPEKPKSGYYYKDGKLMKY